jgi:hypothetical protein
MSTQPSTAPRYVAVGQNVNYWVSGDGINWNYKNNMGTTGPQLNGLVFGNNTWVAVGGSGGANCVIYYSSDAITWTQASCPTNIALKAVAFGSTGGSNYFAATGDDGSTNIYTFYSSNGSSWSNAAYSPQTSASSAAGAVYDSGNNAFVFTSNLTTSVYSTSFANLPTSINPQTNSGISGGGFLIQSVAGTIVAYGTAASNPQTNISTNSGSTWAGTVTVSGCGTSVNGLAFGSSTYVATCSSGSCGVSSSSDATTWSGVANSGGSCSGLTWAYATFSSTDSRFVIVDNSANPNFSSSSSGTTGSFSAPVSVTSGNQVKAIATRP